MMKIAIPRVTEFDIATITSGHFLTRGGGGLEQGDEEGTGSGGEGRARHEVYLLSDQSMK